MIKTPVIYDETATVFYPYPQIDDADGEFLFEFKEADTAKEIVKRINMHDELVAKLTECANELNIAINRHNAFIQEPWGDVMDAQTVHECFELLERCK